MWTAFCVVCRSDRRERHGGVHHHDEGAVQGVPQELLRWSLRHHRRQLWCGFGGGGRHVGHGGHADAGTCLKLLGGRWLLLLLQSATQAQLRVWNCSVAADFFFTNGSDTQVPLHVSRWSVASAGTCLKQHRCGAGTCLKLHRCRTGTCLKLYRCRTGTSETAQTQDRYMSETVQVQDRYMSETAQMQDRYIYETAQLRRTTWSCSVAADLFPVPFAGVGTCLKQWPLIYFSSQSPRRRRQKSENAGWPLISFTMQDTTLEAWLNFAWLQKVVLLTSGRWIRLEHRDQVCACM